MTIGASIDKMIYDFDSMKVCRTQNSWGTISNSKNSNFVWFLVFA